jgi:hypothetical protein
VFLQHLWQKLSKIKVLWVVEQQYLRFLLDQPNYSHAFSIGVLGEPALLHIKKAAISYPKNNTRLLSQ